MEKARYHRHRFIRIDRVQHPIFRDPVERVERQRNEENVFHFEVASDVVMSSEVETSLNISVLTELTTTEIVRDSSTSVGMTKMITWHQRPSHSDHTNPDA